MVKRLRMIGIGLAVVLASILALANRSEVLFSLDPIAPAAAALSVEAPLYLVIFAAMLCGILLGGFVVWRGRRKSPEIAASPPAAQIIEGRST